MKSRIIRAAVFLAISILLVWFMGTLGLWAKKASGSTPTAPTHLKTVSVRSSNVTLRWTYPGKTENLSFLIYQNDRIAASTSTDYYTITNLLPSTSYSFYIRAKDSGGNLSSASNIITVLTPEESVSSFSPESSLPSSAESIEPSSLVDSPESSTAPIVSASSVTSVASASPISSKSSVTSKSSATSKSSSSSSVTSSKTTSSKITSSKPASSKPPSTSSNVTTSSTSSLSVSPPPSNNNTSQKIIAGYYASWSAYQGYTPLSVPAGKLTHLHYAFAKIGDDLKIALGDPAVDTANFSKLNELKKLHPHLKVSISVGGWTWSDKFSDAALTDARRSAFADSVVSFLVRYNFDGVDLDWEYPVGGGLSTNSNRPEDKTNFTLLLQKLREKLDQQGRLDGKNYLLSIAGGAGSTYVSHTELKKISAIVNYAIIMTYDLHGTWDTYTDFNAPLYTPPEFSPQYKTSVNTTVQGWLNAGFSASKLVLGVPFYGYMYNNVANSGDGLYKTFTKASSVSYDKIVATYLPNSSYTRRFHPDAKVPWLFNGSSFITYDDEESIAAKAAYVKSKGLAGVGIWEISQNKNGVLLNSILANIQ